MIRTLITAWALFGGLLLLIIVALTAMNVAGFGADAIARLWGGTVPGVSGFEDAVTLLVGVAALAMFPYCQLHGAHASVDVLMSKAPVWANAFIAGLSAALTVLVALGMAVMLGYGMLEARSDRVETAVLGWPVWVFMAPAIVSCLLWAIAAVAQLRQTQTAIDGA